MEVLDNAYLNDLVLKAQRGSSNAFAELYAVTYQRQYDYSCEFLQDIHLAKQALQESFIRALKGLSRLQDPEFFVSWLSEITFHVCNEIRKKPAQKSNAAVPRGRLSLDMDEVTDILEKVFRECGRKPNSVPMEALTAYTMVYRRESFGQHRRVLAAILVLLCLLPFFFVDAVYTVSAGEAGTRKLPVYEVEVSSLLPVRSVTAQVHGQHLPVYEEGGGTFILEPTHNGEMEIEVTLLNRQRTLSTVKVTDVDNRAPVLIKSEVTRGEVLLYLEDDGAGLHLRKAYAVDISGKRTAPVRVEEEKGLVVFPFPEEDADVYIPDVLGNVLHLSMKRKDRK